MPGNNSAPFRTRGVSDDKLQHVRSLLKGGGDINDKDENGDTAIIWASCTGQLDMVEQLLKNNDVDVNHTNNDGDTALMWASIKGHTAIVTQLLKHENIAVNLQDNQGRTALSWASLQGHFEIVVELLKHGSVDVSLPDSNGLTAGIWASDRGYTDIVRCLEEHALNEQFILAAKDGRLQEMCNFLEEGANINATTGNGHQTALTWASFSGDVDVVTKLLTYDTVDVNHQTCNSETALLLASANGHSDIVAQLLDHDKVQVNLRNDDSATALIAASFHGHSEIVYKLLKHENVDVNLQYNNGHTALSWASLQGHYKVVAELLKHEKIDVNHKNNHGSTALTGASFQGHTDIVAKLLKHDKIDVNLEDNDGDTALLEASSNGHYDIVFQLLNIGKVNLNHQNKRGETALSLAANKNHNEIAWCLEEYVHNASRQEEKESQRINTKEKTQIQQAQLDASLIKAAEDGEIGNICDLLEKGANINATDTLGNTALIFASHKGHLDIVVQLLKHDKVDTNLKNNFDCTALMMASNQGNADIVCELLKNHEVDVNFQDNNGQTALSLAACHGHTSIVVKLLQHQNVEVNLQDNHGTTALMMGTVKGHSDVVIELLKHDKINGNCQDKDGDTALLEASSNGYLEIVCELLKHDQMDVNHQNKAGKSALLLAVDKGQLDIVVELLKFDSMNVNLQDSDGNTALTRASFQGSFDIVCELLKQNKVDLNLQNKNGETALTLATDNDHEEIVWCLEDFAHNVSHRKLNESLQFSTKEESPMQEARELLRGVMERPSSDPVELPIEYIQQCTTETKLGTGAFGEVYLGRDTELAKPFVIKSISLTASDRAAIDEIRTSFQREISALKRFRHPNVIVLYGYSLNVDRAQQYLVYEHAANGSLDGFLRDDANRSRLSADIRLSIMFELTRAVHFLHTGGCGGYRLFHRDIKSANICLAEDYTARLIDCGLAKLVPIDSNTSTTSSVRCSSGFSIFGTPGYMCPEYATNRIKRRRFSYKAACDVYSIGVVMVELILGCLIGNQSSSRDETEDFDASRDCVEDEEGNPVANGWELLKEHADPSILWTPMSLDVVCKAAISCMKQTTEGRMTTTDLLPKLSEAIHLNRATKFHICDKAPGENALCGICFLNMSSMTCSEGHAVCTSCIENKILRGLAGLSGRRQIVCPFDGCSSHPFGDDFLYGLVSHEVYILYIREKTRNQENMNLMSEMKKVSDHFADIKKSVNQTNELLKEQLLKIDRLEQGLNRNTALLSLLAAEQFKECPHLVWITPVSVASRGNPKEWIKFASRQKYKVVFICAHSYQAAHEPFEIDMPRDWMVKVAPWLKMCVRILILSAHCMGLPFPIPNLELLDQFELMESCLNAVKKHGAFACESILEQGMIQIEDFRQVQELAGDSFKFIAETATADDRPKIWKSKMIPVYDTERGLIWVKNEYKNKYTYSTISTDSA